VRNRRYVDRVQHDADGRNCHWQTQIFSLDFKIYAERKADTK
jgi:hypothetical protein